MPLTLIETVGADNANTYGNLTEADAYFAERLYSSPWTSIVDDDQKRRALITSCKRLETERFAGSKATTTQKLIWPRVNPYGLDLSRFTLRDPPYTAYVDGYDPNVMAGTAIPMDVKEAQFEYALYLLTLGKDASAPDKMAQFASLSIPGVVSFSRAKSESGESVSKFDNFELPDVVQLKLLRYREGQGQRRVLRG